MMPTSEHCCPGCGQLFSRNSTLKRHIQSKHQSPGATHTCPDCQKEFTRKDLLVRHLKIHIGAGKTPCPRCGRNYRGDYLPKHELACHSRLPPCSSTRSTTQVHFPDALAHIKWEPVEAASPSLFETAKNPRRPVLFVPNARDLAIRVIEENLDLSQDERLLQAIQATITTGDIRKLKCLIAASPSHCNTVQKLAYWYRKRATECYRLESGDAFPSALGDIRTFAAGCGQSDVLNFLMESGLALNARYLHGVTPLHWAAQSGHNAMVQCLLEHGMNINAKDLRHSHTALDYAIAADQKSTVQLLLRKHSQALPWTDRHPLATAIECGNLGVVRLLFELGLGVLKGTNLEPPPLDLASYFDQVEIIDFLLDSGANIDESRDWNHRTPLCSAAVKGNVRAARTLLERGASVNGIDSNFGATPLMYVCYLGSFSRPMIDLLIAEGTDVNLCRPRHESGNATCTALTEACSNASPYCTTGVVRELLRHGSKVNLGSPPPLEHAIKSRQGADTVRLLLKAGADVKLVSEACISLLRGIVDGSRDKEEALKVSDGYKESEEKLKVLEHYIATGSGEVLEKSSVEGLFFDALFD